ncbi:hypothetical protein SDC9_195365 [bioreactor metagenome]|uniref:Uncharacterized protein n=1 Tax=bioreactor metagenome TaxID=1076179 RepID=A0A645I8U3_9ZZZZ
MRPDPLAAAEQTVTVNLGGEFDGIPETPGIGFRQAGRQHGQGLFRIAVSGDGMDDGNHGRDYRSE